MKTIILAIVLAALASCGTLSKDALSGVEYSCASATAALRTVTLLNDKLTPANRTNVSKAVAVINPVCGQESIPTLSSTSKAALDGALTLLTAASLQVTQ